MKKWMMSAALISAFALGGCNGQNDVIVETKYSSMTESEFYEEIKALAGVELLEQIVMNDILEEKYDVTDEEIEELYASYELQYGDSFGEILTSYGYTEETFRDSLRLQALQQKALEDVEISDEEINKYYEQAKYELHARHILVDTEEEAKEVLTRIENGETFEAVAKEVSTDTTSAENGGDLDWFTVGTMVDAFNDAAYALEEGEMSEAIATDYGYHIIELIEKREVENYGTLDEEKQSILQVLKEKKASAAEWDDVEAKLVEEAEVNIKDKSLQNAFQLDQK